MLSAAQLLCPERRGSRAELCRLYSIPETSGTFDLKCPCRVTSKKAGRVLRGARITTGFIYAVVATDTTLTGIFIMPAASHEDRNMTCSPGWRMSGLSKGLSRGISRARLSRVAVKSSNVVSSAVPDSRCTACILARTGDSMRHVVHD